MRRMLLRTRLALGGSVWGGLFGAAVGTAAGTVFGLVSRDISFGLDGALVGGGLGILCGAVYGIIVSLKEPCFSADVGEVAVFTETIDRVVKPRGERNARPPGDGADASDRHRDSPMSARLPEPLILRR